MSALPRPAGEHPERPRGLALGTTLAGLTGLAVVWAGGFGCVDAVRDHLRSRHPPLAPAVTLEAQGACCFAASNETPQGRALNRRVEIVFERDAESL